MPQQLGVFGISLGGITASLAAAAEPRFAKVCPVLAGGDLGRVLARFAGKASGEPPNAAGPPMGTRWTELAGPDENRRSLSTTAAPRSGRKVLMLNAKHDEVIPRVHRQSVGSLRPPTNRLVRLRALHSRVPSGGCRGPSGRFFRRSRTGQDGSWQAESRITAKKRRI